MTHVVLNIGNKKKWSALKTVLEAMDIDYSAQDNDLSLQELEILNKAQSDVVHERVSIYTNHRDILAR